MPIKRGETKRDGKRVAYYQSGDNGKRHTYTPGNETTRKLAKQKAIREVKR